MASISDRFYSIQDIAPKQRMTASAFGCPKTGKTHLAFTMPEPIAFFNFDNGLEGMDPASYQDKDIRIADFTVQSAQDGGSDKVWIAEWERFKETLLWALSEESGVRSIVLDTESEAYELIRLARLGKLTQVLPVHYTKVNAEMASVVRAVKDSDRNFLALQRAKDEYVGNDRTGKHVASGFSGVGFEVQVCLRTHYYPKVNGAYPKGFSTEILECRPRPILNGVVLPLNDFQAIAASVGLEVG